MAGAWSLTLVSVALVSVALVSALPLAGFVGFFLLERVLSTHGKDLVFR